MTDRDCLKVRPNRVRSGPKPWLTIAVWGLAAIAFYPLAIAASAQEHPAQIRQQTASWDGRLSTARLINPEQEITALVVQLEILDKPETTYANAVYQIYARIAGRWVAVYTNTGARLVDAQAGQMTLPPEVILISDMQRSIGQDMDWSHVDLRTVVTLRYDLRDGQSNQQVEWKDSQLFEAMTVTTTPDLLGSSYR